MTFKWIGTICIVAGCGICGFSAAASSKRETRILRELSQAIRFMEAELQYNLTALPQLCRETADRSTGYVREVFRNLSRELDWQLQPDVRSCMAEAIEKSPAAPGKIRRLFYRLGISLGQFDLPGQLKELAYMANACERELESAIQHQEISIRSYRTLGLCTGAALAILFL